MTTLPFNCTAWAIVNSSSNVRGYGERGEDLIVLFKGNSAYRYIGLAGHFIDMHNAASIGASVGKYINEHCKGKAQHERIKDSSKLID
jgi:hypothetical protein